MISMTESNFLNALHNEEVSETYIFLIMFFSDLKFF